MVERRPEEASVRCSIHRSGTGPPRSSTDPSTRAKLGAGQAEQGSLNVLVAQWIEQFPSKEKVGGSSPSEDACGLAYDGGTRALGAR